MPRQTTPNAVPVQLEGDDFSMGDTSPELQPLEKTPEIEYVDSSAQLWAVVLKEGEKYDKTLAESWKGDMDGILFFTGLFSAAVAAFIIDGYKYLSRNSNDTTNQLLIQISQQLSALATGSEPPPPFSIPPFSAPAAMRRVNILWFISLCLSVTCALVATLVQQWTRKYLLTTQLPSSPQRRARVRTYLFQGVVRFRLDTIANSVPLLLHASVFLFFTGIVEFLFQLDKTLAYITLACVVVCAVVYVALTLLPLFYRDCPYQTPMSGPLWRFVQALKFTFLALSRRIYKITAPNWTLRLMNLNEYMGRCKERLLGGLQHDLERCAMHASQELDTAALRWTLQSLREPSELESFIAAIPGFLGSATITSETPHLTPASITLYDLLYVKDAHLGLRIGHLLKTEMHMPVACVDTLWHITRWHDAVDVLEWDRAFGEATVDSLSVLKGSRDPAIALTAHCTAALGVRVVLKDMRRMLSPALATRLRISELRRTLHALMDADRGALESLTDDDLIRDGHVLNMTGILTSAIPLVARVDETRASILWDTLDTLRSGLDARQASPDAQTAIVRAWAAYEEESQAWTPASGGIPYQPPGSVGRYRSRMEDLVAPIIRDIGGE
ncbi:hypothetical protein BJV78DRAFT_1285317 [Lactifluus subvellereus]|nr:hypothetical protein BJV78DRAFT_1285317 [Lactifluus subvellereus]